MSKLYVDANGNVIQAIRQGVVQNIAYTGTQGRSAAFADSTTIIRIVADTACFYLLGKTPTATTSNGTLLPAGAVEYVPVNPGDKISAIQSSAGGTLNITEGGA